MNCFFCGKKLHYNPTDSVSCALFDGRFGLASEKVFYITLVCLSNNILITSGEETMSGMDFCLFPSTGIFINILKRLTELGTKFEGAKIV